MKVTDAMIEGDEIVIMVDPGVNGVAVRMVIPSDLAEPILSTPGPLTVHGIRIR